MSEVLATDGRLDVLVNNAGITGLEAAAGPHDPEHVALDDWRAVHHTNLDGVLLAASTPFAPCDRLAPVRSSTCPRGPARSASRRRRAYASSKAAVRNHTKTVALYCAEQGLKVRCNAILPAAVLTPMWDPMLGDGPEREQAMAEIVADTPLRRFADPAEVAALAVLLASDEAPYMTGSELTIDGGLLAGTAARPR